MHRHLAGVLLVVACVQAADDGNDTAAPPGRACFFEHAPQGSKLSRAPCRAGNRECSQDASDFLNQSCLMPVSTALPPDLWSGRPSRGQQRDCTTCTLSADAEDGVDQLRRGLLSSFAAAAEGRVAQEAEGSGITSQESCLVMMGDSMMRQLFTSLVFLVRGAEHVVDYNHHTHAAYSVCDERDMLSFPAFSSSWDNAKLQRGLRSFFASRHEFSAQNRFRGHPVLDAHEDFERHRCVNRLDVWYLWLPSFRTQEPVLDYLMRLRDHASKDDMGDGDSTATGHSRWGSGAGWEIRSRGLELSHCSVMTSVGFWEHGSVANERYLDLLRRAARPLMRPDRVHAAETALVLPSLVLVTTPVQHVYDELHARSLRSRNQELHQFCSGASSRIEGVHLASRSWWCGGGSGGDRLGAMLVDFEGLAADLASAPHVFGNNWHYQAFVSHQKPPSPSSTAAPAASVAHREGATSCWEHASPGCLDFFSWWISEMRSLSPKLAIIESVSALTDGSLSDLVNRCVWCSVLRALRSKR